MTLGVSTLDVLVKMSVLSAGGGNDSFVQMLLACKTKGQLCFSYPAAQLVPRRGSYNRVRGCLRVLSGVGASFSPAFAAPTISRRSLFPASIFPVLARVTFSFSRRIFLCRQSHGNTSRNISQCESFGSRIVAVINQ